MSIIAASRAGLTQVSGFLNGCYVFSVLSAANTSLYVSSRALYGLALEADESTVAGRCFGKFGIVDKRKVPVVALAFSALAFWWLPWLQLKGGHGIGELTEIIAASSSFSLLVVWAALSLAFIRYKYWLDINGRAVEDSYPEYDRRSREYQHTTLLYRLQPFPAWIGFLGCLVVLAFTSASWWNSAASFSKVAVSFGAPIVLFVIFVALKIFTRRKWVTLTDDDERLADELRRLRWYKRDETVPARVYREQNFQTEGSDLHKLHADAAELPAD